MKSGDMLYGNNLPTESIDNAMGAIEKILIALGVSLDLVIPGRFGTGDCRPCQKRRRHAINPTGCDMR